MFVWKRSAIAAVAVAFALLLSMSFALATVSVASVPAAAFTVVLDAGHGGIDPGVLGVKTKTKESEINLKIVKKLEKQFISAGFRVVLTRKNGGGLYGLPTEGYKQRDMRKRKEIIEAAQPNAVISVHQNNFVSDRSRRGGQVFFKPSDENGRALADCIQGELNALGGYDYSALRGDYYMLNCSSYPSVIVECGFLSNAEDEALLLSEEYQEEVALAIFKGALSFFA